MSTYTIRPSSTAALLYITCPDMSAVDEVDQPVAVVYMSSERQPEASPEGWRRSVWLQLPLEVRAQVNRHFGWMFSLPVERRQAAIDSCMPWCVEVVQPEAEKA